MKGGEEIERALEDLTGLVRWDAGKGLILSGEAEPGAVDTAVGVGEDAVLALRDLCYARYFCRWAPEQTGYHQSRYADRSSGEPAFVAALAAACRGATYWESGWHLVKSEGEWAFVSNGRICLFVEERRLLDPPDARDGHKLRVLLPCARENLSPGFFYLIGRAGPIDKTVPHVKVYLNLSPEGAAPLLEALLTRLGVEKLCFEGKLVNDPAAYCRVDTGLLYVEPASYSGVVQLLLGLKRAHRGWFRGGTPLFTREIAPGMAVAESPWKVESAPLESFGQHRCRLLSEAVVSALGAGETKASQWLLRVRGLFSREGLSVDRPYVKDLKAKRTQKGLSFQRRTE